MIARLLHYYIITRLNSVFIKKFKSDGRKRERARGYVMYSSMVLWDIALKNLGNMTNKDSDKISCRF